MTERRYRTALSVFMVVVLAHWAEHVVQTIQVFVLGWSRPDARGVLGMVWPWLVQSEALHYGYAVVMLVGIVLLRPAFSGSARTWWNVALALQIWHHLEHLLLLSQAVAGRPFFGAAQYTSLVQLVFPRIELHLVLQRRRVRPDGRRHLRAVLRAARPRAGAGSRRCAVGAERGAQLGGNCRRNRRAVLHAQARHLLLAARNELVGRTYSNASPRASGLRRAASSERRPRRRPAARRSTRSTRAWSRVAGRSPARRARPGAWSRRNSSRQRPCQLR